MNNQEPNIQLNEEEEEIVLPPAAAPGAAQLPLTPYQQLVQSFTNIDELTAEQKNALINFIFMDLAPNTDMEELEQTTAEEFRGGLNDDYAFLDDNVMEKIFNNFKDYVRAVQQQNPHQVPNNPPENQAGGKKCRKSKRKTTKKSKSKSKSKQTKKKKLRLH